MVREVYRASFGAALSPPAVPLADGFNKGLSYQRMHLPPLLMVVSGY